jgi:hypothetical protein
VQAYVAAEQTSSQSNISVTIFNNPLAFPFLRPLQSDLRTNSPIQHMAGGAASIGRKGSSRTRASRSEENTDKENSGLSQATNPSAQQASTSSESNEHAVLVSIMERMGRMESKWLVAPCSGTQAHQTCFRYQNSCKRPRPRTKSFAQRMASTCQLLSSCVLSCRLTGRNLEVATNGRGVEIEGADQGSGQDKSDGVDEVVRLTGTL